MLEPLKEDLERFYFHSYAPLDSDDTPPGTYGQLHQLLVATSAISCEKSMGFRSVKEADLKTSFGKYVLGLVDKKVRFGLAGLACCPLSEHYLQRSLCDREDKYGDADGPLLIIEDEENGEIIAVQKHMGDPSVYAIANRPDIGLYSGTFSAPIRRLRPSIVESDNDTVKVAAQAYRSFVPRRIATTMVDMQVRKLIAEDPSLGGFSLKGLLLSHHEIVEEVTRRSYDAAPFASATLKSKLTISHPYYLS